MPPIKHIKNPKNPKSNLYKKLTRLFSGPIIDYRSQTIRKYRRSQLDKFAQTFKSLSGQQFKKSSYNPFHNLQSNVISAQNRVERYADFDQMEYTPEIASALDIYADEMTTSSDLQPLLKIDTPNEEIKTVLHSLYHNIMNIEFNLFGWCRTMCKYGDMFLYVDVGDEAHGIKNIIALPYNEVERIEGEDKTNPNYVQFQWNQGGLTFENWQIAHFRILGNDKFAPYGTSTLEPARRIWRQLTLLEDAMMAYRIVRSPERRVFYIDTGNIPPQDVEQYMQKVMTQMKRNQIVDADTGRVDLRYNPLSVEEDYFIPVRGGVSSRVENLPGGTYTGDIDDVKYLRDKLFSALKIPQSYLSRGEGADEDKTTLAQKDIRFARTIQRLQRVIVSELEKIGVIHLYSLGYRGNDLISFKLKLNNPSKIAEMQELEHWKNKFDIAASATEGFFSRRWIADHIFDLSEEDFMRNQRELFSDRKFMTALDAVVEGGEEMEGGLGAGEMGEIGGEFEEGAMPPEGELPPEEGGAEPGVPPEALPGVEAPPEEESALLAAPGKRDDGWIKVRRDGSHTTSGAKGKWYEPVAYDGRVSSGPRTKNYRSMHTPEFGTPRKLYPGFSDLTGLKDLNFIGKGLMEGQESNYKNEEDRLTEINNEVKSLIDELENRKDEVEA
tara:strand:+ start:2119 stop:4119 length:2001 start_codon:yes stop_codon:yes gene_type:complete